MNLGMQLMDAKGNANLFKTIKLTMMINTNIRGFPKVDHSDRSVKIVLEQIKSAKKTTPNRT